jgi:uncharacterized protein (TIGR03067 family)
MAVTVASDKNRIHIQNKSRRFHLRIQKIAVIAGLFLGATLGLADDQPKDDHKALQGAWQVGSHLPKAEPPVEYEQLVFKGDKLIFHTRLEDKRDVTETEFKLDPKSDPKEIDITPLEGGSKGQTYLGIYELKEGNLTIAYRGPGEKRPANFNAKQKDNGNVVFIYLIPPCK